jgi:hypothetical protein
MMAYYSISILAEGEGWGEIVPFLAFVAIAVISSIVKGMKEKADARKAQEADGRHSMRMKKDDDTHSMQMKNAKDEELPWQTIESPKPPKIKLSRGRPSQPADRDGLFAQLQQSQPVQGIGAAMAELTPIAPLKPEPKPAVRRPQPVVRKRKQSGNRIGLLKQQPDPILESSLSESDSHIHIRVAMSASMAKKGIILQEILSQPIALRE